LMVCSSSALRPASTNVNPSVEPTTCLSSSSAVPVKPDSVIVTKVVPSCCGVNTHSTTVGVPYPGHSMRIRSFGSMASAVTGIDMSYISQSHCTCLPASSLPLPLVNQNLDVMSGLINASKTSATGFRMSISALD